SERGDEQKAAAQRMAVVSTHAPLVGEGRQAGPTWAGYLPMFQPTPLSSERGDDLREMAKGDKPCFNPRPSRRRGATPRDRQVPVPVRVSTHAPLVGEGRHFLAIKYAPAIAFQPTPLSSERGDTSLTCTSRLSVSFQPTPLSSERGDVPLPPHTSLTFV